MDSFPGYLGGADRTQPTDLDGAGRPRASMGACRSRTNADERPFRRTAIALNMFNVFQAGSIPCRGTDPATYESEATLSWRTSAFATQSRRRLEPHSDSILGFQISFELLPQTKSSVQYAVGQ